MNPRKAALLCFLLVVIAASAWQFYSTVQFIRAEGSRPPNILIVSTCSLRVQMLKLYGMVGDKEIMPHLEKFFRESDFAFANAMNGIGWTALSAFTKVEISQTRLMKGGYKLPGRSEYNHMFRVPGRKSRDPDMKEDHVDDSDFEKEIVPTLARLKAAIRDRAHQPFLMTAHIKYMHYPLIDKFNGAQAWEKYLDAQEKKRVAEYLRAPQKYFRKMPLLLILANDPRMALAHPKVKALNWKNDPNSLRKLSGLITNPEFVAEWKGTPDFATDLQILEKIYRANAEFLDPILGSVLDLYGDRALKQNTIVIFAGDHGEMHMERDELTHGLSLWDEAMRVPVAIRFPERLGHGAHEVLQEPIHYGNLARLILKMVEGENTRADFKRVLSEDRDDVIIGRDCRNSVRGLRYKNKYKYFVNVASGERFLFDLERDPGERENLAATQPGDADKMETLYWENLPRFTRYETYYCAPWNL